MRATIVVLTIIGLLVGTAAPLMAGDHGFHDCTRIPGGKVCLDVANHRWVICNVGWTADTHTMTCEMKWAKPAWRSK